MKKSYLAIAAVFIIALGAGVFVWQKQGSQVQKQVKEEDVVKTDASTDADTSDWKMYRNEEYGFEVKIPKTWEVDVQGHAGSVFPSVVAPLKDEVKKNVGYSIQFSFGPHETKAGGYLTGIFIESSEGRSVDGIIKKDFSWENQQDVLIQDQSSKLLCWKSGCKHGSTGIDERFVFERDGMIWQVFGSVSVDKGSDEDVRRIEDFFSSIIFLK